MPQGFQVIGDSGATQIDGDWANYALVQIQTILTVDTNWRALPCRAAIHEGSWDGDLVFAHMPGFCMPLGVAYWNGTRRVGVSVGSDTGAGSNGPLNFPITFYVFRRQPPTGSTYGVQVFDASGQLVFDAASNFCKVSGVVPASSSTNKYYLPGGRRYALLMPSFSGQYIETYAPNPGPGPNFFWYIYANCLRMQCDSDGIQMNGMQVGAYAMIPSLSPGNNRTENINGPAILVADVTGY